MKPGPRAVDLTGRTFDGWLVVRPAVNISGPARWLCRHTCENPAEVVYEGRQLRKRAPKHCSNCRPAR